MGFPRQEYWFDLSFPPTGIFPTQGLILHLQHLLNWQADSLPLSYLGSPLSSSKAQGKGSTCPPHTHSFHFRLQLIFQIFSSFSSIMKSLYQGVSFSTFKLAQVPLFLQKKLSSLALPTTRHNLLSTSSVLLSVYDPPLPTPTPALFLKLFPQSLAKCLL